LSLNYNSQNQKLLWLCERGHKWYASANSLIYSGSWCPACYEIKLKTIKKIVMKSKALYLIILIAGLMFVDLSVNQVCGQTQKKIPAKLEIVKYTCPMHSEVVQDHPGKCPKCGMNLVEKKEKPKGDMHPAHDSITRKHDYKKMMHDSNNLKKDHMMMTDTTSLKHAHKVM